MAIRKKRIQVVLFESEMEQFKAYAEPECLSMSEILRDYIKSLIKPSSATLKDGALDPKFW